MAFITLVNSDLKATVSECDAWLSRARWVLAPDGYPKSHGRQLACYILEMKLGRTLRKREVPDHINGDKLDNRRTNIRLATIAQNARNRRYKRKSATGFLGVYFHPRLPGKYVVRVTKGGKPFNLGPFDDVVAAAKAYNGLARRLHGRFATLNKIPAS